MITLGHKQTCFDCKAYRGGFDGCGLGYPVSLPVPNTGPSLSPIPECVCPKPMTYSDLIEAVKHYRYIAPGRLNRHYQNSGRPRSQHHVD